MMQCKLCGKEFVQLYNVQKYCSDACSKQAKFQYIYNYYRRKHPFLTLKCKQCGAEFTQRDKRQVFCSLKCNQKFYKRKNSIVCKKEQTIDGRYVQTIYEHRDGTVKSIETPRLHYCKFKQSNLCKPRCFKCGSFKTEACRFKHKQRNSPACRNFISKG